MSVLTCSIRTDTDPHPHHTPNARCVGSTHCWRTETCANTYPHPGRK